MSVIPKKNVRLDLYEGSTLSRLFTFYTDSARTTLKDLTGYTAALQVRASYGATDPILSLINGTLSDPPDEDVLVMGGAAGTIRMYVTDETMADLDADMFTAEPQDDGSVIYTGVWDLELTNADGETSRYLQGRAVFSPEVTK